MIMSYVLRIVKCFVNATDEENETIYCFFDLFRVIRGQSFFFHELHETRKLKKIEGCLKSHFLQLRSVYSVFKILKIKEIPQNPQKKNETHRSNYK